MEGLGKDKGRPKGRARALTVAVTGSGGGRRRSASVAASGGGAIAVYSSAKQHDAVRYSTAYSSQVVGSECMDGTMVRRNDRRGTEQRRSLEALQG
jgi:hypothetical protein